MTLVNRHLKRDPVALQDTVLANLRQSLSVHQALLDDPGMHRVLSLVGQEMVEILHTGRKILFFGNGGSAADAQHLAAELLGRFERHRRPLPAIALTANTSALTALSNDYSYDNVFARQLQALGAPGDMAVGISTSGQSPNVLKALHTARTMRLVTVGLTGSNGRALADSVDHCILVPTDRTARVQEVHILIGHILCEIVEDALFSLDS